MNEVTIHGNVTAEPVLRHGRDGQGSASPSRSVGPFPAVPATRRGGS